MFVKLRWREMIFPPLTFEDAKAVARRLVYSLVSGLPDELVKYAHEKLNSECNDLLLKEPTDLKDYVKIRHALFTQKTMSPGIEQYQKIRTICEELTILFQDKCKAFCELHHNIVKLNYGGLVLNLHDEYNVNENSSAVCNVDVIDTPNQVKTNSDCVIIMEDIHTRWMEIKADG
ncbi:uncharacterized protein LOC118204899 [Stegodyphus dumicola]|uniref:uncharacterized protein LOC118204899 n=1 Tax=Stegodyphus dumicola TaxID=202533 RepID=UPI0015A95C15|nr:uncharacterized protein LOC118204899 [Stegodyphus dumicola]